MEKLFNNKKREPKRVHFYSGVSGIRDKNCQYCPHETCDDCDAYYKEVPEEDRV